MIITGDFNSEIDLKFMRGFIELRDKRNFHRHNKQAKKTFIDRIFTNFDDVGILDIWPSLEKVTDDELGHKASIIYVGKKPNQVEEGERTICTAKNIKKALKTKPNFCEELTKQIEFSASTLNE